MSCREYRATRLRGLVTEADLPQAEREWPGLEDYLRRLPRSERPATFLELVWRFERWRAQVEPPAAVAA